ncbi:hypothetical protein [Micromonospora cremea]|uniref:hypothetical protein n=1 Tax=Micromonospora cremea TaxID=709881 RepID=UPI001FCB17BA|nr:hypothetical protein [Micromonospora cremea]
MPTLPTEEDLRLTPVLAEERVCAGVTTLRGRIFLSYPSADRPGVRVAEALPDGRRDPYPDAAWNRVDQPPDNAFVNVNGLRAGPDGRCGSSTRAPGSVPGRCRAGPG